ncbi:hypothetical protein BKA04_001151 [Cryobacterium mesophilum]|uniref:Transcriptional regulator, AbiEi antitoxin, Type IV TA system n=1 Tax=Terrimesophilobacter mesophilus TaxID=433647 RepID=A0A4R8VA01_9MICO|nr:hypothetical protein [Terrimesophilobacter mesophilus]MBB5632928.1 hypothetical protein [Terrimesophilobacter mesophilus]TFB79699.1 hypothetical protein E3N84_06380 [Terrimesophilobacter mesophilus]
MPDIDTRLRYARDLGDSFRRREDLARSATSGRLHRVARGAYLPADVWTELDDRKKYLTLIRAVATTRQFRPVLSHFSAAAIHGLPMVGAWPSTVHTIVGPTTGGRSRNSVVKHSLRLDDSDVVEIGGLFVTSVARTVLDVATLASPLVAVTMADRAVHVDRRGRIPPMTTKAALFDVWERSLPARAHARTKEVIEFSTELADSPLESVSRVNMRVIGCPLPRLQFPFSDYRGFIGETDFDWPSFNLIGEADGDIKYLDELYRGGRSAEQVMRDERVRENRLRALKLEVSRWNWSTAIRPAALRAHLRDAGLPIR